MATLKICLMVHVEDTQQWPSSPSDSAELPARLGYLATVIGQNSLAGFYRGAKLSVQVGSQFLNANAAPPNQYSGPSSLRMVLEHGGNLWPHCHDPGWTFFRDCLTSVASAYEVERNGGAPMGGPQGRSGGWSTSDPQDWVSMTVGAGLRFHNSPVMISHALVPQSARPYAFSDEELNTYYPHDSAPGPLYQDVMTMRARPMWASVASDWFGQVYAGATEVAVSSVLVIAQPGRFALAGLADRRAGSAVTTLTSDDLSAALTEIWTTFQIMTAHLGGVSAVWYKQLSPRFINQDTASSIGAWVDSVNGMLLTNHALPLARRGRWMNMNEIGSTFLFSAYL